MLAAGPIACIASAWAMWNARSSSTLAPSSPILPLPRTAARRRPAPAPPSAGQRARRASPRRGGGGRAPRPPPRGRGGWLRWSRCREGGSLPGRAAWWMRVRWPAQSSSTGRGDSRRQLRARARSRTTPGRSGRRPCSTPMVGVAAPPGWRAQAAQPAGGLAASTRTNRPRPLAPRRVRRPTARAQGGDRRRAGPPRSLANLNAPSGVAASAVVTCSTCRPRPVSAARGPAQRRRRP